MFLNLNIYLCLIYFKTQFTKQKHRRKSAKQKPGAGLSYAVRQAQIFTKGLIISMINTFVNLLRKKLG